MAASISSLDPSYVRLINDIMSAERQPLNRLTKKRDDVTLQKSVYTDLKKQLDTLQSAVRSLNSSSLDYTFNGGRKVSLTGVPSGSSVLTATASSTATPARYNVSVETLAREHIVRSKAMGSISTALGLSGTFLIGAGERAQTTKATLPGTVDAFGTAELAAGQTELTSGSYWVETRGAQFRMVDAIGQPINIRRADGQGYSADWQDLPAAGSFDTGRGLTITLGANPVDSAKGNVESPAAQVQYDARFAAVDVEAGDTLVDVANRINKATFPANRKVVATVVDGQLLLTADPPGTQNTLSARDLSGGVLGALEVWNGSEFQHPVQSASNAVFYVNGLRVERAKNRDLTDVIHGVTLSLSADAAISKDKPVTIEVVRDSAKETETINTFLSAFNNLQTYLGAKLATTKQTDGSYKRGSLAGDSALAGLRQDLLRSVNTGYAGIEGLSSLSALGITLNNDLKLTVSDTAKLDSALRNNKAGVSALMDKVMAALDDRLGRFTGEKGYVQIAAKSLDTVLDTTNTQITQMNERLTARETALVQQYAELQAQLVSMTYMSSQLSAMFGATNRYF
jgi:flagellar capping protein FliD